MKVRQCCVTLEVLNSFCLNLGLLAVVEKKKSYLSLRV